MKIEIEIPKEFEGDYNFDKFEDFFMRVSHDIEANDEYLNRYLCGNYEAETAEMFVKAFQNSIEKK
jgi:hypothetical protein|uniref:Uncharacterized protein n=1 Tax=Siphoviridae sp. ct43U4 TaxID=2826285 RepID=A0A8S5N0B8_9CAUD|nr:MAG TPA: hypothetical protein [Siphoviridae sp. ct43U4]